MCRPVPGGLRRGGAWPCVEPKPYRLHLATRAAFAYSTYGRQGHGGGRRPAGRRRALQELGEGRGVGGRLEGFGVGVRRAIRGSWGIQDLPMGATLLVYGERGSRANPQITARVYTVNPDSTLSLEAEAKGRPGPGHSGTRSSVASERIRRRPTSPSSATSCWHSSSGTGDGRWSNHESDNHRCVGRPRESGAR